MRISFLLLLLLSIMAPSFAQQPNGALTGTIVSYQEEALAGVTVRLQNTNHAAATNTAGHFIIRNIPAGTYTVIVSSVGYSAQRQNIRIEAGKTASLNVQLSEDQQRLVDVVITGKQNNYRQPLSSIGTRTDAPLIETPQSAQVLGQQVIKDRQAVTLNEMTPLMTGVKPNNGMGAYTLRGFTGYNHFDGSFISFNGIRGNLYQWSQAPLLYNIEKIEVLRGPASVLYSEGIPGGMINFVTLKPLVENHFSFDASYGSWNFMRFAADATGAITKDKKLLYRLIAGYDRSNSFRDQQKTENFFIAPSLTYRFSPKTALALEVNYAKQNTVHQYDRGAFVKALPDGTYDFDYYPDNLTVQSPTDFGHTNNTSASLVFNHRINNNLSFTIAQRAIDSRMHFADHGVSGAIRNDSISRSYQIWDYAQFSWQTTAYANYKINTGGIKHNILAGIDYNNYGWSKNDYRNSPSTRIYILKPDYSNDVPAADPAVDYYDDNKQNNQLLGGYLQDQVSIGEKLKVLLSIRYDDFRMKQTPLSDRDDLQGDTSDAHAWMPRVGAVYMIQPNISVYGTYNKSFNPQRSNSAGSGGPFPPRASTQFEVGYKGDFFREALSTTVALYTIKYSNILAADPTPENPNRQSVVDGTRSRGVELTVQGNIKDLSIIAGYAYNEHRLTSDNTIGKKNFRYANAPDHIANAWLKYNFSRTRLKGLGIGFGGRYVSDQVGNLATQNFVIPASFVLDAAINYKIGRFNLQANINNITNTRYFNGGLSRVTIASLGNPFNFRTGITYSIN
ncbi:TonB-dependent receptor [Chitinophaga sedimenti]|uniref:TonB-dependent receptor n=1 Tax=Chitinophaga sedimenti TaxID=2033606 RepID=UPI002004A801|nr:TonB-dependent receptor [Chitinophaga sedimenti]MCK7555787.1 TonB-dependent receptor [Chitinophaga sedimenti]